jgi:hypothetical protein
MQAMLVAKMGSAVSELTIAAPKSIVVDARRAWQVNQLPMIEIIPQVMPSMKITENTSTTDVYRRIYNIRIDVGTEAQSDYVTTADARLDLLQALTMTMLRNQELTPFLDASCLGQTLGIEATSITEEIGPISQFSANGGPWWGQATLRCALIAQEVVGVPSIHEAPLNVMLSLGLMDNPASFHDPWPPL